MPTYRPQPKTLSPSELAAQEILALFVRAKTGVRYVSPILFEGKTGAEIRAIKRRIQETLDRYFN